MVKELLIILISSSLVNNVVLSQFLGLCPFLGVSKKTNTAAGMGVAIVSYLTVEERVAAGEVLSFELEERPVERNIYMAWRTKGELTPAAKEFSAFVRKSVKGA